MGIEVVSNPLFELGVTFLFRIADRVEKFGVAPRTADIFGRAAAGGFDQCYNAQVVVATASLLVIATAVVQAPNDKQQIAPMLEKIDALSEQFGRPETLLADNGYFSEANAVRVRGCSQRHVPHTPPPPAHVAYRCRQEADFRSRSRDKLNQIRVGLWRTVLHLI